METLGHRSRAVHQAYAKKVEVDLMPLEYYERKAAENIVDFQKYAPPAAEARLAAVPLKGDKHRQIVSSTI
ncbi:MAG: hypothetical protein HC904_01235 [Blastochloris sp.]|nr:hypothetical protein [Blastochloris sp.]